MDKQNQVIVNMCGVDGTRRVYFWGGFVNRTTTKVRMNRLKNSKKGGKDEITTKIIKNRVELMIE